MLENSAIQNIDNETMMDWLAKSMKSVESGRIMINMGNEPAMQVNAPTNRIDIDLLHPELFKLFKITEDEEKDQIKEKDEWIS